MKNVLPREEIAKDLFKSTKPLGGWGGNEEQAAERKMKATKEIHRYTISRMCCIPFSGDETRRRGAATTLDVVETPFDFEYLRTVIPAIRPSYRPGLNRRWTAAHTHASS